jgi:hypothetical protein
MASSNKIFIMVKMEFLKPSYPLCPAATNDFRRVTIFDAFYLYRAPDVLGDPRYQEEEMWRFEGVFASVRDFIDKVNWSRLEKLEGDEDDGESGM